MSLCIDCVCNFGTELAGLNSPAVKDAQLFRWAAATQAAPSCSCRQSARVAKSVRAVTSFDKLPSVAAMLGPRQHRSPPAAALDMPLEVSFRQMPVYCGYLGAAATQAAPSRSSGHASGSLISTNAHVLRLSWGSGNTGLPQP